MKHPFNDSELRDLFFTHFEPQVIPVDYAVTMGSGPFHEEEFDDFLRQRNIIPCNPDPTIEIVVVGWVIMDEETLISVVARRRGMTLKVYSQEMFLWYLLTGTDPFDQRFLPQGALLAFAENHAVLELLSTRGFDWPTTNIDKGFGLAPLNVEMPARGMLGWFGYSVGRNGLTEGSRRNILATLFCAQIPPDCPVQNAGEWGASSSSQRLHKMADTIASLCRNLKRRRNYDVGLAIAEYESDLQWLETNFYERLGFRFIRPNTYI